MPEDNNIGNLRVSEKDLPQAKDWEVGKKYSVTVELEMMGVRKETDYSVDMGLYKPGVAPKKRPKIIKYDFDVKSVSPEKKKEIL